MLMAYVKRSKNDANDAAAICEAITRPSMRIVATKSEQQQCGLMLHRSRQLLVCQRMMLSNAVRGHMAELGIISAKGRNGTAELLAIIANEWLAEIPGVAPALGSRRASLCPRSNAVWAPTRSTQRDTARLERLPISHFTGRYFAVKGAYCSPASVQPGGPARIAGGFGSFGVAGNPRALR
jgi:transposase